MLLPLAGEKLKNLANFRQENVLDFSISSKHSISLQEPIGHCYLAY